MGGLLPCLSTSILLYSDKIEQKKSLLWEFTTKTIFYEWKRCWNWSLGLLTDHYGSFCIESMVSWKMYSITRQFELSNLKNEWIDNKLSESHMIELNIYLYDFLCKENHIVIYWLRLRWCSLWNNQTLTKTLTIIVIPILKMS